MVIHGTVINTDVAVLRQNGSADCEDNSDIGSSDCFVIGKTTAMGDGSTFAQKQLLDGNKGLPLSLIAPQITGWTFGDPFSHDGTAVNTFWTEPRPFNPIWINYGIYRADGTTDSSGINWEPEGYRFRTPMNPKVGSFYANMEAPSTLGTHKIQWIYKKDPSSYAVAVDQNFTVDSWGNGPPPPYAGPAYSKVEIIPAFWYKNIGDSAMFTMIFHESFPAPITYQWRMGGNNITDGTRFSGATTNTLSITGITMDECWKYYDCVISGTTPAATVSTKSWIFFGNP